MSKRAGAVSAETKEAILKAARAEFAMNGFQGTSLRKISSEAGVTTGAIYFFFKGKDELFEAVISSVTKPFLNFMKEHYDSEENSADRKQEDKLDEDFAVSVRLIDFYFQNKQSWDILLNHLNQPAVQSFIDGFVDYSAKHYTEVLMQQRKKYIDPFAVHQYVHMQVDAMLTLISHDFGKEEMLEHSRTITKMLRGAFSSLLED